MKQTYLVAMASVMVGCVDLPEEEVAVESSELSTPEVGYYCSRIYPTNGWTLMFGSGDTPCVDGGGGDVRRVGMYAANNWNTVEVRCAPNYYWMYVGWGSQPLSWAYDAAANTSTGGRCEFFVTMNSQSPRQDPVSPIVGCASGGGQQELGLNYATDGVHRLVGCAGDVSWNARNTLCAPGWKAASAATWVGVKTPREPLFNYWTDDDLRYQGPSTNCTVSKEASFGQACPSQYGPMRVCTASGSDAAGNSCTWKQCRLDGTTGQGWFGGCYNNPTAGTICEQVTPYPSAAPAMAPHTFNRTAFTDAMRASLDGANLVGYQFAALDAVGTTVSNITGGQSVRVPFFVPMASNVRWNVGSTGKLITATALVAAIEDLQRRGFPIDFDTSIRRYLPSTWSVPAAVRNLTFRHVLRHRTGLVDATCGGNDYASLRTWVQAGPTQSVGDYRYSNCGYGLLRILVAYLVDGPNAYLAFEGDAEKLARLTAMSYRAYVRGRLLAPIGLGAVDEYFTGSGSNQYFRADQTLCNFAPTPDESILRGGPGYWTLSAMEYARFLSNLTRGKIVSPTSFEAMIATDQNDYTFALSRQQSTHGYHYEHSGGHPCGPASHYVTFPNGMVSMFVTNTNSSVGFQPMINAFNGAVTP